MSYIARCFKVLVFLAALIGAAMPSYGERVGQFPAGIKTSKINDAYLISTSVADHSASSFGSVKYYVDLIGAGSGTIVFPPKATDYAFALDYTIPANVEVIVQQGSGFLAPATSKTLTLGKPPQAGAYQIFGGAGSVVVSGGSGFAEWWGIGATGTTNTSHINTALASGLKDVVLATDGNITVEGTVWMRSNVTFRAYSQNTALKSTDATASSSVIGFGQSDGTGKIDEPILTSIKVVCNRSNNTQRGIYYNGNYQAVTDMVVIESCYGGGVYAENIPSSNGNWWLWFNNVDIYHSYKSDNSTRCIYIGDNTNEVHWRDGRIKDCNIFLEIGNSTYGHSDNSTETHVPSNVTFTGVDFSGCATGGGWTEACAGRPPANGYGWKINGRFVTMLSNRYEDGRGSLRSDWWIGDWANGVVLINNMRANGTNLVFSSTIGGASDGKRRGQVFMLNTESQRGLTDRNSNDVEMYNMNFGLFSPEVVTAANTQPIFWGKQQDLDGTVDPSRRIEVFLDGIRWGSGSSATDVGISRSADNGLKIDGTLNLSDPLVGTISSSVLTLGKGNLFSVTNSSDSVTNISDADSSEGRVVILRANDWSNPLTLVHTAACTDHETMFFRDGGNATLERHDTILLYNTGSCWRELDRRSAHVGGYTLQVSGSATSPPDTAATTYYPGGCFGSALQTGRTTCKIYVPKSGTVKSVYLYFSVGGTPSSETSSLYFRLNDTTDTTISSSFAVNTDSVVSNTGLNIAVAQGDYFTLKWVMPSMTAAPDNVRLSGTVYIE